MRVCDRPQRLKKAQRHERREDVGFDAVVKPVVDGTKAEVVLQLAERILDLSLDHVAPPDGLRVAFGQVRPQQVGSLVVRAGLVDAFPVEMPRKRLGRDLLAFLRKRDRDHLPDPPGLRYRDRKAPEKLVARQFALRGFDLAPPRPADAPVECEKCFHRAAELLHAHGRLLERARRRARQDERVARPLDGLSVGIRHGLGIKRGDLH